MMAPMPGRIPRKKPRTLPRAMGAADAFHCCRLGERPRICAFKTSWRAALRRRGGAREVGAQGEPEHQEPVVAGVAGASRGAAHAEQTLSRSSFTGGARDER